MIVERVLERLRHQRPLGSTYRLQFQGSAQRFSAATQIVPYLQQLGVTHVYSSPLSQAAKGSTHGYDVVDPTRLNSELGSVDDYGDFVKTLHQHGLGQLLDIVPNHMSVANDENLWWMDVLRHGPASHYSAFFDIDWKPVKGELDGRVLLPVLDGVSGDVLEEGRLPIRYERGEFAVGCNACWLPLDPKTCAALLSRGTEATSLPITSSAASSDMLELQSIVAAINHLPDRNTTDPKNKIARQQETVVIQRRLSQLTDNSTAVADQIAQNVQWINGQVGAADTFDALDQLLEDQAFRLVHWKAGSDEINYRRFFDVTTLAALSVENLDVFEETHAMIFQWAASGQVDALRVDHVDGLFDPTQYLWRLQWGLIRELGRSVVDDLRGEGNQVLRWENLQAEFLRAMHGELGGVDPTGLFDKKDLQRPQSPAVTPPPRVPSLAKHALAIPVFVEKILGAEEPLPTTWPVVGTTGYEFLNMLNGLFVDPQGMKEMLKIYERFVPHQSSFQEIVYECKRLILSGPMQSEIQLLGHRLDRLSNHSRYSRDFTLNALQFAMREIIACFSVYRTYIRDGAVSKRDEQIVQRAVAAARRRNPAIESETFEYVKNVLLLREPENLDDQSWREREYLVGRFQQVTSPVQAKGVEDTAFYRYIPLLSLEEVGSEPTDSTKSIEEFHEHNQQRQSQWPFTMLTTTTHDTKRTEDVRARINVLTEVPGQWRKAVQRWHRLNRKFLRDVDGHPAPSRNDEWLLYQTLVGMWPTSPPNDDERNVLVDRLQQYMEKATHEAKVHTSWISPSEAYDKAVREFIASVLTDRASKFPSAVEEFVETIIDAGLINAASQVLIKLTAPGRPDVYQGQEIWNFSLVDPDNRRPVDYPLRQHLLSELVYAISEPERHLAFARHLAHNPRDNRLKLLVTYCGLQFRKRLGLGQRVLDYVPLTVQGDHCDHVCAFAWHEPKEGNAHGKPLGIVVVPRFVRRMNQSKDMESRMPWLEMAVWGDTKLLLPEPLTGPLVNSLTGQTFPSGQTEIAIAELLSDFPLGLYC